MELVSLYQVRCTFRNNDVLYIIKQGQEDLKIIYICLYFAGGCFVLFLF